MANDKKQPYEVGYGKPPASSQFKKGISGNPKGRPKGSLNSTIVLLRVLRELVVINENGRRKTITKMEAAFKQLVNQAAGGNMRAITILLSAARAVEEPSNVPEDVENSDADQQVLANFLRRVAKNSGNPGDDENE